MKTAEEILKQSDVPLPASSITFKKLTAAMEAYAEQFKPKWISVDDGFPEDGQEVNISVKGKTKISTFRINNGHKQFYCGSDHNMCYGRGFITHWQPLPEPPTI